MCNQNSKRKRENENRVDNILQVMAEFLFSVLVTDIIPQTKETQKTPSWINKYTHIHTLPLAYHIQTALNRRQK